MACPAFSPGMQPFKFSVGCRWLPVDAMIQMKGAGQLATGCNLRTGCRAGKAAATPQVASLLPAVLHISIIAPTSSHPSIPSLS